MSKRRTLWVTGSAIAVGILLFCSGMSVGAATNEPGSASDPLITKSYLEKQLKNAGGGYECITLAKGELLEFTQGTQVILYTGSAKIQGNLVDITDGVLCNAGAKVTRYHSYLVPADGSGFQAEATCVIFISEQKQ